MTTRVDKLAGIVAALAKTVDDGFKELRNDIKGINTRLDYIVSANNLKDLPDNRKI
ncbi:MAG: hypothetical protein MJ213_04780 [Bacilli bacterium]|nr:hypothetical protein [Bacilli bacterium]